MRGRQPALSSFHGIRLCLPGIARRGPGTKFVAAQRLAEALLPPHRLRALLQAADSPQAVFALPHAALTAPPLQLTARQVERLAEAARMEVPEKMLDQAARMEVYALSWRDPAYPANLLPFNDSPPLLFVRGELLPEHKDAIGIVGSRRATVYGRGQASRFAGAFAEKSFTVVSGGAAGIDTVAHRAAIDAGGRTVAVLGCGPDIAYPAENRALFAEIAGRGAVLSEFSFGTRPEPWRFPTRNRIIAGMSRLTLVVEAPEDSGALITARYAGEYGRDVWAVPGAVDSGRSRGCHRLIQDGAGLADSPDDVLEALHFARSQTLPLPLEDSRTDAVVEAEKAPETVGQRFPAVTIPLSPDEEKLLSVFGSEPQHMDAALTAAGLGVAQGLGAATLLEMKGLLKRLPGNFFTRTPH